MMNKKLATCILIAAMAMQSAALAGNYVNSAAGELLNTEIPGNTVTGISNGNSFSLAAMDPNSAGPDVRDPAYYYATDKVFLGTWECTNDPNSRLTIKEANPQTGGYYADFFFYRLAHADGYANISGDKLSINQGSVNDNQNFRGIFEKIPGGIRFTVTESGFNYLKPGDTFEYKKMSGKPVIADSDILGTWTLRSWVNAKIVKYEFTKDNQWIAYSPQWVGPDPKPKTNENGVYKKVAAGSYKVMHEGNYNPIFKLFEADGKFYAYVSIVEDANAGCKMLSINGRDAWFYNDKENRQ